MGDALGEPELLCYSELKWFATYSDWHMGEHEMDVFLRYHAISIEVVHVEHQFEFGLKGRIVDTEHGFHEFLLIDVFVCLTGFSFVNYVEKPLA